MRIKKLVNLFRKYIKMDLTNEINDFFIKYGKYYELEIINYTKQVVHKIKTSPVLKKFLDKNNISASILLNEITPYSQFKLIQYGDEKLDMKEIQSILNIILFSNEIEQMILDEHIFFSSIGKLGEIFYKPDAYAAEYFNQKYQIEMDDGKEFDFTILEDYYSGEDDFNFGIN
jgi:hypothetical protein